MNGVKRAEVGLAPRDIATIILTLNGTRLLPSFPCAWVLGQAREPGGYYIHRKWTGDSLPGAPP